MKKVCIALLFISCLFAILFELTGNDPDNTFTFRSYFKYVTENITPFPTVDFKGDIFADFSQIFTYVFRLADCVVQNIRVLLYGLFPVNWSNVPNGPGQSGGGGVFGDFAGGGFGGGGGGAL